MEIMQIWRRCWQNTRQLFQFWHTAEGLLAEIMTKLSASSQFLPLHYYCLLSETHWSKNIAIKTLLLLLFCCNWK